MELIKPKKLPEEEYLYHYDANSKLRNKSANNNLLRQSIHNGFKPYWYIVGHFNDAAGSTRQQKRRLDIFAVEDDLKVIKEKLYRKLYGARWSKLKRRARSIWSIEYGDSKIKPHFNLLLEQPPAPYNSFRMIDMLFNYQLPRKVRCLWKDSTKVEKIKLGQYSISSLATYILKESDCYNQTLIHNINDYIIIK
tara:strand:+ start:3161 stop:3742 length:582 start_codon:yes stop_codon:yes gene_type:complete